MERLYQDGNATDGIVVFDFKKFITNGGSMFIGLFSVFYFQDLSALIIGTVVILVSMYVGAVGYHRLMIHRSFSCPRWVEYILVYFSSMSGMGTPLNQLQYHDLRDWAQRKRQCHNYFSHREGIITDGLQQLFCRLELNEPPKFKLEVENQLFYRLMENFWLLNQLPLALVLFYFGGWSWVGSGIFLKIFTVRFGHWLMAYFLHNYGQKPVHNTNAGVQGYNIPLLALLTFGESYHNNHHFHPDAAKNAFRKAEVDPAWWLIRTLERFGLVKNPKVYNLGN